MYVPHRDAHNDKWMHVYGKGSLRGTAAFLYVDGFYGNGLCCRSCCAKPGVSEVDGSDTSV